MAEFEPAIDVVLLREGGFVDHPSDPGGATHWGVSLRWLAKQGRLGDFDDDGDVDVNDIRAMTRAQASEIYRVHWWDQYRYGELTDQTIANKVFDLAVNMGPKQCTLLAQRVCTRMDFHRDPRVVWDGQFGPRTRAAINSLRARWFLIELQASAADFYRLLVHQDARRRIFEHGWLARAYA